MFINHTNAQTTFWTSEVSDVTSDTTARKEEEMFIQLLCPSFHPLANKMASPQSRMFIQLFFFVANYTQINQKFCSEFLFPDQVEENIYNLHVYK